MDDITTMERNRRVQHCSSCKNHGSIAAKRSHKCPFLNCKCILCKLLAHSQLVMRHQQRVWRFQKSKLALEEATSEDLEEQANVIKSQVCDTCRNHNSLVRKKSHDCPFINCKCEYCSLTYKRRELMKHIQRVRRSGVTSSLDPDVAQAEKFLLQNQVAEDESSVVMDKLNYDQSYMKLNSSEIKEKQSNEYLQMKDAEIDNSRKKITKTLKTSAQYQDPQQFLKIGLYNSVGSSSINSKKPITNWKTSSEETELSKLPDLDSNDSESTNDVSYDDLSRSLPFPPHELFEQCTSLSQFSPSCSLLMSQMLSLGSTSSGTSMHEVDLKNVSLFRESLMAYGLKLHSNFYKNIETNLLENP